MDYSFKIDRFLIRDSELDIKIKGECCHNGISHTPRFMVFFESKNEDRTMPINVEVVKGENGNELYFVGEAKYDLRYIFNNNSSLEEFRISFIITDGYEDVKEAEFFLPQNAKICTSNNIEKENNKIRVCLDSEKYVLKKPTLLFKIYEVIAFVICILLLPLFLIDGIFASKGFKELEPQAKGKKGIKAIIYHANSITKRISLHAYSKREFSTYLFKTAYGFRKYNKIKKNQVLFLSERKEDDSGNIACVKKYLEQDKNCIIKTFIDSKTVDKLGIVKIFKVTKLMAESKVIVLDDFYPQIHSVNLKKETKLIQLWHACGAFKTFGFSRLGKVGGPSQKSTNHRSYDYAMVSSSYIAKIYSEAFGISRSHIKAFGAPRTDIFFDESYKENIRKELVEKYKILANKKVILLAPTFRGDGNKDAFYETDKLNINTILNGISEEYVIVIKNHPFVKDKFLIEDKFKSRVIDLSLNEDINNLLFITDILITDYSSVIFEAALLSIPMLFYAYDLEEYLQDRDVYYDFRNFVPGKIVYTEKDLLNAIINIEEKSEKEKLFIERFLDAIDGDSTRQVSEFIKDILE